MVAFALTTIMPAADAMRAVVAAMNRDPAVGRATREGFLAARRNALKQVIERGVERGDLRADIDVELALEADCAQKGNSADAGTCGL